MNKWKWWLAAGLAIVLFSSAASAEGQHKHKGKGHNMPTFAEIDADEDGVIVADEFYKFRGERMAKRARAGGKMKNAAKAPSFEDIDTDGDGKVSVDEFAVHQADCRHGK